MKLSKVSITISESDKRTLEAVLERAPWLNAHAVARVAMRLGLCELAGRPDRVMEVLGGQRMRFPVT